MLIEFRVRNFRSIRDEQVLSMVANDDTELLDSNTIETGITTTPRLVRSAAIYGANASGKSNLIKAMIWMQGFIFQSAKVDVNQLILNDPFLFDGQSKDQPTLFEISFMLEGVHYQYGIEVTRERVITEYLFDFKQPEPHSWFEREYDSETGTYDFVSDLGRGETEKVWRESTKPNSLFLAVAVQLNSTELKPIYDFFFNRLKIARNALAVNNMVFAQYLEIPETKAEITDFLHRAGIVFEEIQTKRHKGVQNSFLVDQVAKTVEMTESEAEFFEIGFVHKAGDGTVKIDLSQESEGTIKIFAMAGPILEFLKSGNVFIVDELELSLHTHLVEWLVMLFNSKETNSSGAQLIFTTHNTTILNDKNFRRDQIWFIEKNQDEVSEVVPLSDYKIEATEDFGKGYIRGRYGAVPYLSDFQGR